MLATTLKGEWQTIISRPWWLIVLSLVVALGPLALPERTGLEPTSLLPPSVTLGVVLLTRRVVLGMLSGIFVGSTLHHGLVLSLPMGVYRYFFSRFTDTNSLCITGFALSVLSMVRLSEASSGMRALIAPLQARLRSARATMLGTAGIGLLVFFDDYANTMLVGPTLRPITDRQGISREKLAYIVDSTAAPVAGLAIVSTWLGYEVGLLDQAASALGLAQGGYGLLLLALPQRFYCLFALALVFIIGGLGRDYGPMLEAERQAALRVKTVTAILAVQPDANQPLPRGLWLNAALPVTVLLAATFIGFLIDGGAFRRFSTGGVFELSSWQEILSSARNGPVVLLTAGLSSFATAIACSLLSKRLDLRGIGQTLRSGFRTLSIPLAVLFCAWALGGVCKDLQTGNYLVTLLRGEVSPALVPLLTFLVAAAISFATGTSWGTMAILVPAALPLSYELGALPLMILTIAAVMDGAIFGDHCSPMSDTTLLSSVATGCEVLPHVLTQLPYALTAMLAAALAYALSGAFDSSLLLVYPLGLGGLLLVVRLLGQSPRTSTERV